MNTITKVIFNRLTGYLYGAGCSRGGWKSLGQLYLILGLLIGFTTTTATQAADFPSLDEATPSGGNSVKYAPVFDFDGDGCLPSAGISRAGVKNDGSGATGTFGGNCRSPYFLIYSNTLHRYACLSSGGSSYCGHIYALYFKKDQTVMGSFAFWGHRHDWEHVAVWTKDGNITHVGVSAHGDMTTRPIMQIYHSGTHPKVVYHKDGARTHAMRFAHWDDYGQYPYYDFVTPPLISWYELTGDNLSNQEMRDRLNTFCYRCDPDGGGSIGLIDSQILVDLNKFKPSSYPVFTEASVAASKSNGPVFYLSSNDANLIRPDDDQPYYQIDFGQVHKPLIGNRWLIAELQLGNLPFPWDEASDSLDGDFDTTRAAPYSLTGFAPFTGLVTRDFIRDLKIEISTAGYGPGPVTGEIEFQPIGQVDTGAREPLDPIILKIGLEISPAVDAIVAGLPDSSIRTGGNRIALWNFLIQARANAQSGNTDQAIKKLQQALERTDGCVLRGSPDTKIVAPLAKDYIIDCADQELVYTLIQDELSELEPTINGGEDLQSASTQSNTGTRSSAGVGSFNLCFLVLLLSIRLSNFGRGKKYFL